MLNSIKENKKSFKSNNKLISITVYDSVSFIYTEHFQGTEYILLKLLFSVQYNKLNKRKCRDEKYNEDMLYILQNELIILLRKLFLCYFYFLRKAEL